jgi:hypothetical protein
MKRKKDANSPSNRFSEIQGFDDAMRKIVATPKAEVDRREDAARKKPDQKK